MRRLLLLCVGTFLCWTAAEPAQAQLPYGPYGSGYYSNPTLNMYNQSNLSPYLNLLRGGNPAVNYYQGVQGVIPDMQQRAFMRQATNELDALYRSTTTRPTGLEESLLQAPIIPRLPQTGHPTGFLNYGPYFASPGQPQR